jgi:hypothetical protein
VQYLGHIASPEGITTDTEKLKAAHELSTPKNKHEVKRFLGLCTHYVWFTRISVFTNISKPLTKITEKKQTFHLIPVHNVAFKTLNEALCLAPLLALPLPGERFAFDTDAVRSGLEESCRI